MADTINQCRIVSIILTWWLFGRLFSKMDTSSLLTVLLKWFWPFEFSLSVSPFQLNILFTKHTLVFLTFKYNFPWNATFSIWNFQIFQNLILENDRNRSFLFVPGSLSGFNCWFHSTSWSYDGIVLNSLYGAPFRTLNMQMNSNHTVLHGVP